jgi:quinol-cytochrome oxidoreductase complex cytochrome b subunit
MGVYMLDNYTGIMLCLVMAPIFLFILIVALIAELLDRSKVPRLYYKFMITGVIVPILVLIIGVTVDPGALDWLSE